MSNRSEIVDYIASKYPTRLVNRRIVLLLESPAQRMDVVRDVNRIMSQVYGKNAKSYELMDNRDEYMGKMSSGDGIINVIWTQAKSHYFIYQYINPAMRISGSHITGTLR